MNEQQTLNRREVLHLSAATGVAALGSALVGSLLSVHQAQAEEKEKLPPTYSGNYQLKPLPFSPAKLNGLSEKLIVSHHENNYGGAIKNLTKVEKELSQATKDTPPFVVAGLKQSGLTFRNSMVLHEFYFGNLGGNGKAQGKVEKNISDTYGSFGKWEEHFRQIGAGLGGGSGWVILSYDLRDRKLMTDWSGHHSQVGAFSLPILVMDMYEHAYQMDYGAAAAKYIDAFFKNLNWEEVDKRLETAQKIQIA